MASSGGFSFTNLSSLTNVLHQIERDGIDGTAQLEEMTGFLDNDHGHSHHSHHHHSHHHGGSSLVPALRLRPQASLSALSMMDKDRETIAKVYSFCCICNHSPDLFLKCLRFILKGAIFSGHHGSKHPSSKEPEEISLKRWGSIWATSNFKHRIKIRTPAANAQVASQPP